MSQVALFCLCLLAGGVLRLLYRAETWVVKRTNLLPVTVLLDVALALVAVAAYGAVLFFFCSGQVFPFSLAALIVGFLLVSLFF